MTQNVERARALRRATKLIEQTTDRGRTQSEMEFAMKQLDEIKRTFDISLDEITLAGLEYKSVTCQGTAPKGDPMSNVSSAIARYTNTKHWYSNSETKLIRGRNPRGYPCYKRIATGNRNYHYFGVDSDVQMAEFLFEMIKSTMEIELEKFKKSEEYLSLYRRGAKRSAQYSFRHSFTNRLAWTLDEMAAENTREMVKTNPQAGDLVVSQKAHREAKFEEMMGIKLVFNRSYATGGRSSTGSSAGHIAGKAVNLNRPMSGGRGQLLLG